MKPKEAGAASSLNTTARDYALFFDAVLNGKGFSSSVFCQMETPEIALDPTCRICVKQEPKELSKALFWGLGWGIQREHKSVMLCHWGDNGVFKVFVMADPARKSGVVMFANGEDALNVAKQITSIRQRTRRAVYANTQRGGSVWDCYRDLEDARSRIGEFLEQTYNRQRLQSALGYLTPEEFEQASIAKESDSRGPATAHQ
jgi:CubicO group peptidase (beta-lactamase class C family)